MDDYSIRSARGKLTRARTLLEELDRLHDAYLKRFTATIRMREVQLTQPDGEWTVTLVDNVPDPPEEIAHVAGDAMHNVRSALDHVACACVLANGTAVTRRNAFPIREKRPACAFTDLPAVQGMSASHAKAIHRLQPYMNPGSPDARKLVHLAVLDNADKHRVDIPTIPTCVGPAEDDPPFTNRPLGQRELIGAIIKQGGDIRLNPEVARVKAPPDSHAWVPVRFDLAFGHPDIYLTELDEIRAYVVGIVESFGPVLDQPTT